MFHSSAINKVITKISQKPLATKVPEKPFSAPDSKDFETKHLYIHGKEKAVGAPGHSSHVYLSECLFVFLFLILKFFQLFAILIYLCCLIQFWSFCVR